MTRLFGRAVKIVADTIEIVKDPTSAVQSLDVAFSVDKDLKKAPNTAQVKIWNLNRDHQDQLAQLEKVPVSIEAGYQDQLALLYLGNMRSAYTVREGPDLVTIIESGDGEKQYTSSRVNVSVGPGTGNDAIIKAIAKGLGVGEGNLADVVSTLIGQGKMFPSGTVLSGQASREMTLIADSFGLEWSIQDGALQLLSKGKPLLAADVLLTPETGLVGAPSVDSEGVLTLRTLIIPDILPGRSFVLQSEFLSGRFRAERCGYVGDTSGDDWYIDIEAKKL